MKLFTAAREKSIGRLRRQGIAPSFKGEVIKINITVRRRRVSDEVTIGRDSTDYVSVSSGNESVEYCTEPVFQLAYMRPLRRFAVPTLPHQIPAFWITVLRALWSETFEHISQHTALEYLWQDVPKVNSISIYVTVFTTNRSPKWFCLISLYKLTGWQQLEF
jgi:hypothetical protein